jgi:hypothetical protein
VWHVSDSKVAQQIFYITSYHSCLLVQQYKIQANRIAMARTKLRNTHQLSHHLYNSSGIAAKCGDNEFVRWAQHSFWVSLYLHFYCCWYVSNVWGFNWCVMGLMFLADQLSATGLWH